MEVAENVLGYFSDAVLRDSSKNCVPEATSLEHYNGVSLLVSGAVIELSNTVNLIEPILCIV